MAKFKFSGGAITAFGYTFKSGEFTTVPDSDESVCRKLRNNPEFTQGRQSKKKSD